jgi:general secretion pathway protein B
MSYVLDALRRAEAERHRGDVPDLHAQPAAPPLPPGPEPAARGWVPWALGLLLLGATLVGGWRLLDQAPAPLALAAPAGASTTAPVTTEPRLAAAAAVEPGPQPVPPRPVSRLPEPPAPSAPAVPKPPAAGPERLPTLQQLPESLRRQLPAFAFGGAADSPSPAARMLIINGQVHREGDEIAPGLVLERISLRSAQMRFQGQRFEVVY